METGHPGQSSESLRRELRTSCEHSGTTAGTREEPLSNGTTVVKIGGSTLGSHDTTLEDLVALQREGRPAVVVHGGGKVISDWMEKQGVKPRFVRGLRVTDEQSLDIAVAVLTGLINKDLVASLAAVGGRAMGMSGADGGMIKGRRQGPRVGACGHGNRSRPRAHSRGAPVGVHSRHRARSGAHVP